MLLASCQVTLGSVLTAVVHTNTHRQLCALSLVPPQRVFNYGANICSFNLKNPTMVCSSHTSPPRELWEIWAPGASPWLFLLSGTRAERAVKGKPDPWRRKGKEKTRSDGCPKARICRPYFIFGAAKTLIRRELDAFMGRRQRREACRVTLFLPFEVWRPVPLGVRGERDVFYLRCGWEFIAPGDRSEILCDMIILNHGSESLLSFSWIPERLDGDTKNK